MCKTSSEPIAYQTLPLFKDKRHCDQEAAIKSVKTLGRQAKISSFQYSNSTSIEFNQSVQPCKSAQQSLIEPQAPPSSPLSCLKVADELDELMQHMDSMPEFETQQAMPLKEKIFDAQQPFAQTCAAHEETNEIAKVSMDDHQEISTAVVACSSSRQIVKRINANLTELLEEKEEIDDTE